MKDELAYHHHHHHLSSERFGVRQLNQDNLFISFYGLVLGASFAAKRILLGQWTYKIAPVQVKWDILGTRSIANNGNVATTRLGYQT